MHDLRRLRAFHAVAERRSFSEAALDLGYAQSAVSHHIAALEAEFGLTLVDRSSRPVRLTPAGERLRHHAVAVLSRVVEAEEELRALTGLRSGTLRIGAFQTACTSFVPPSLARFAHEHPKVELTIEQAEPEDALRRVRAGDIDLAIVFTHTPPVNDGSDGLSWQHLSDDPFRLVLPPTHRLARKRTLRVQNLAGERFCAPPRTLAGSTYHEMLDALCAQGGFTPTIAYPMRDIAIGRALIAAGLCIAVMGEHTIPHPRPDVIVRRLPGDAQPQRTISAAWLRNRQIPAVPPNAPSADADDRPAPRVANGCTEEETFGLRPDASAAVPLHSDYAHLAARLRGDERFNRLAACRSSRWPVRRAGSPTPALLGRRSSGSTSCFRPQS